LIQGKEAITGEKWKELADPKPKFHAVALISVVAKALISKEVREHTESQMKLLTETV